jgi:hypothetical protein
MKKFIAGAALALVTVGMGGTAFAGEVTGSGRGGPHGDGTTPVATYRASSICSFNGLDDGSESGQPVTPGVVQSFGFLVAGAVHEAGGASGLTDVIRNEGPGAACRGNLPDEGPG